MIGSITLSDLVAVLAVLCAVLTAVVARWMAEQNRELMRLRAELVAHRAHLPPPHARKTQVWVGRKPPLPPVDWADDYARTQVLR